MTTTGHATQKQIETATARMIREDAAIDAALDAAFEAHNRETAIVDGEFDAELGLRSYRVTQ